MPRSESNAGGPSTNGFEIDPENDATAKEIACISGWLLKASTKNDPFPSMHTALNVFGVSENSKAFLALAEADARGKGEDGERSNR